MNSKKLDRLCIFVFFDKDGHLGKYVEFLLSNLKTNSKLLYVICNGQLDYRSRKKLSNITENIYVRDNIGFEPGAWQFALVDIIGFDKINEFDEIIFMNDICYGPVIPFEHIFHTMDKKDELDFWGITKHYEVEDFTGFHKNNHIIPEHIQTYFFAIRKKMFQSFEFKKYWMELPVIKNYIEDIGLFETKFTTYFKNCGFQYSTFIDMEEFKGAGLSNFCVNYDLPYTLLLKGMPLIRRKSLTQTLPNSCGGPEKDPKRVFEFLKNKTSFDTSLIWEDLLRKNNISDIYTRLNLNYVLPREHILDKIPDKRNIALFMHIYYEDQIDYCYNYAKNMPSYADIFITTSQEHNIKILHDAFSSLDCHHLEIRKVENRGRDMSAFFVGCADLIKNNKYDYICCIHDKKSPQVGPLFSRGFRDITFENTLSTKKFVLNIIETFEKEPALGYLGFPKMIGGPYWPVFVDAWASPNNFDNTVNILKKCNVNVNISKDKAPILYANVFWCRPKALEPLFSLNLTYQDFDEEPMDIDGTFSHALERAVIYVAQSQGFYSGVLFTDEYASIYITALAEEYKTVCRRLSNKNMEVEKIDLTKYGYRTLIKEFIKKVLKHHPILYRKSSNVLRALKKCYK